MKEIAGLLRGAKKKLRDEALIKARELTLRFQKKGEKASALLYGSYAKGDFNLWVHADVLLC